MLTEEQMEIYENCSEIGFNLFNRMKGENNLVFTTLASSDDNDRADNCIIFLAKYTDVYRLFILLDYKDDTFVFTKEISIDTPRMAVLSEIQESIYQVVGHNNGILPSIFNEDLYEIINTSKYDYMENFIHGNINMDDTVVDIAELDTFRRYVSTRMSIKGNIIAVTTNIIKGWRPFRRIFKKKEDNIDFYKNTPMVRFLLKTLSNVLYFVNNTKNVTIPNGNNKYNYTLCLLQYLTNALNHMSIKKGGTIVGEE